MDRGGDDGGREIYQRRGGAGRGFGYWGGPRRIGGCGLGVADEFGSFLVVGFLVGSLVGFLRGKALVAARHDGLPRPPRGRVRRLRGRDRPGHRYDRRSASAVQIGVICARIALRQNGEGVKHRRCSERRHIRRSAPPLRQKNEVSHVDGRHSCRHRQTSGAEVAEPTKSATDSETRHTNATRRQPAASSRTSGSRHRNVAPGRRRRSPTLRPTARWMHQPSRRRGGDATSSRRPDDTATKTTAKMAIPATTDATIQQQPPASAVTPMRAGDAVGAWCRPWSAW